MWADLFKRWVDLAFWWLPREERRPQAQEKAGAPAAGRPDREAAHERVEPERVVEPKPAEPEQAEPQRPEPARAEPERSEPEPAPAEPDDLTVIKGIGAAMQERLRSVGIATFRDLAAADADTLTEKLQAIPVVVSRARVEAWIDTARGRV